MRQRTPQNAITMLQYRKWNEIELEVLNPLLERQLVVGEAVLVGTHAQRLFGPVPQPC